MKKDDVRQNACKIEDARRTINQVLSLGCLAEVDLDELMQCHLHQNLQMQNLRQV